MPEKILFQNKQWTVTASGLSCGSYFIAKSRLKVSNRDNPDYDWIQHMREKNWVDQVAFAEALNEARLLLAPDVTNP